MTSQSDAWCYIQSAVSHSDQADNQEPYCLYSKCESCANIIEYSTLHPSCAYHLPVYPEAIMMSQYLIIHHWNNVSLHLLIITLYTV